MSFLQTLSPLNQKMFSTNRIIFDNNGVKSQFDISIPTDQNKSYFWTGSTGTGKTFQALQFIKSYLKELDVAITEQTSYVKFVTFTELCKTIRDQYSEFSDVKQKSKNKLEVYKDVMLLCIDDLGKDVMTDIITKEFNVLFANRYECGLQTIITSNFAKESLQKIFGDPSFSRMLQYFTFVEGKNKDLRTLQVEYELDQVDEIVKVDTVESINKARQFQQLLAGIEQTNPTLAENIRNGTDKRWSRFMPETCKETNQILTLKPNT